jgi:hypothetical protein
MFYIEYICLYVSFKLEYIRKYMGWVLYLMREKKVFRIMNLVKQVWLQPDITVLIFKQKC